MRINTAAGNCLECQTRSLAFDAVFSLGRYEGSLQKTVVRMKYTNGESVAMAVGKVLAQRLFCADLDDQPELLTCVPKYWLKRLLTGVNSAETIMSGMKKQAKLPAAPDLLMCRRRINKQSMLSPDQRRRNVKGAWTVSEDYSVGNTHVMVVDDIMTTGATAHEIARALKLAGARRVTVAVVGRAAKSQ